MDQNAGFLALNAGSSSLKVALFPATGDEPLVTGQAERIGPEGTMKLRDAEGNALPLAEGDLTSHAGALAVVIATVKQAFPDLTMAAVGHRVVHGGLDFSQPVLVDEDILRKLSELEPFAPLHQPHNIAGEGRHGGLPRRAAGGVFRHRIPSRPAVRERHFRDPAPLLRGGRAPLWLPRSQL